MVGGILGIISIIAIHFLAKWWEDENIDKSSSVLTGGGIESEVNRATENRKREKRNNLKAEVRRLNEAHSDRRFYRDGPRIQEYTSEEAATIRECERLNAQYAPAYPHYFIRYGRVEYNGEAANTYKFEAKMREINQDPDNIPSCRFDHRSRKLMNTLTDEEIPFDPDSYTLPPSHFRG